MKKGVLASLLILVTLISFQSVKPCSANLGKLKTVEMSGVYTTTPDLEMPRANVTIHIAETSHHQYSIQVSCSFLVVAGSLCNSSLAFVYPATWHEEPLTFDDDEKFNITLDHEPVEYDFMDWEQAQEAIPGGTDAFNLGLADISFARFNETLTPDCDHIIEVQTAFVQTPDADRYWVQYVFGSARSFSGDTYEIIELYVEQQSTPLELNLSPSEGLTVRATGLQTEAKWDFLVGESEQDRISVEFVYSIPQSYYPIEWMVLPAGACLILLYLRTKQSE
jgi:hypothetical protein